MADLGNYRLIKQIGEGGFGRLYQVEHVLLREKACLKQNKIDSPEEAEMLRLEARLLWKLDEHHSIPSTKDFFEIDEDNFARVMSFVEGKTVENYISSNSRVHPEDACWITERLLGALYYCHYNGISYCQL